MGAAKQSGKEVIPPGASPMTAATAGEVDVEMESVVMIFGGGTETDTESKLGATETADQEEGDEFCHDNTEETETRNITFDEESSDESTTIHGHRGEVIEVTSNEDTEESALNLNVVTTGAQEVRSCSPLHSTLPALFGEPSIPRPPIELSGILRGLLRGFGPPRMDSQHCEDLKKLERVYLAMEVALMDAAVSGAVKLNPSKDVIRAVVYDHLKQNMYKRDQVVWALLEKTRDKVEQDELSGPSTASSRSEDEVLPEPAISYQEVQGARSDRIMRVGSDPEKKGTPDHGSGNEQP